MQLIDVRPMVDLATTFNNAPSMSAMPAAHTRVKPPNMRHNTPILIQATIVLGPAIRATGEMFCLR